MFTKCNCDERLAHLERVVDTLVFRQPKRECDHSGLKRYCGEYVYCEACKQEISKQLCDNPPHDGPCKKHDPVEEKIQFLALNELTPVARDKQLRELVELARKP